MDFSEHERRVLVIALDNLYSRVQQVMMRTDHRTERYQQFGEDVAVIRDLIPRLLDYEPVVEVREER